MAMPCGAVLIVDDNVDTRRALAAVLTIRGYETVGVCDGAEALSYLRRSGAAVSLVVLDLCMPRMDGFEFLHARAADPTLETIPVVVFSALNRDAVPRAVPFVRKGADPDHLLAVIEGCKLRAPRAEVS
jgi:chemotaxis family two-component system sensor histidine kinase/response regulator PixL